MSAVKDVRDKAKALQAHAKDAKDTALFEKATRYFTEAETRAGELLIAFSRAFRLGYGSP